MNVATVEECVWVGTAYKMYARIINQRLQTISEQLILEEENSFRKGRSCTDSTFIITQIIEEHREFNKETHVAFIDFEKTFDGVSMIEICCEKYRKYEDTHNS